MGGTLCFPVWWLWVGAGVVALWLILKVAFPWRLWIAATAAGAPVPAMHLLGMRLRRTDPRAIVNPYINAVKAGVQVDIFQMEAFYMAGGNVDKAVLELIRTAHAGTPRTWTEIAQEQLGAT